LTLEDLANRLSEGVRAEIVEFNQALQKTEARAGAALAQQVKASVVVLRQEIQKDIDAARLNAADAVRLIDQAHKRNLLVCCGLVLVAAMLAIFGAGVWVGTRVLK
jgi:hypothetical protein